MGAEVAGVGSWRRWAGWLAGPALALAYVISGKLGLMLALPPGYASAIFPPAGIAIAAALVAGRATLPWTLLGSFVLNLSVGHDPHQGFQVSQVGAAAIIAAASMLQAWVGGWWLGRLVGRPATLDSGRSIVAFLLASPVVCLISATLSIAGLWLLGFVPGDSLAANWAAWWIGDSIGALVMVPLTLAAVGQPAALWRGRLLTVALPVAIAFAVIAYTYVAVSRWEQDNALSEFRDLCAQATSLTERQFDEQEFFLEQTASLIVHDTDGQVTRDEFQRFSADALKRFKMVAAVEWAPRVDAAHRRRFEAGQQAAAPGFAIRDRDAAGRLVPAKDRPLYFPVTYVEPLQGNETALGFDLLSLPSRAEAVTRALALGRAVATEPIHLVQDRQAHPGMLLLFPVTRGPHAGELVLTVLRVDAFMGEVLAFAGQRLQARLVDVGANRTVFDSFTPAGEAPLFAKTLQLGAREFRLEAAPSARYLATHRGWQSWSVLALGLFGTGLFGALLLLGTGQASHARRLVEERTRELRESEALYGTIVSQAGDGIVLIDPETLGFVEFNDAACEGLGYSRTEFGSLTVYDIQVDLDRTAVAERLVSTRGTGGLAFENRHRCKNGEIRIRQISNRLVRVRRRDYLSALWHDVTDIRTAEWALRESEARYRSLFEDSKVAMIMLDPADGRIVDANAAACSYYGYARETLCGMHSGDINTLSHDELTAEIERARREERGHFFFRHRLAGGDIRDVEVHSGPIERGGRSLLYSIVHDVTDRKQAEEALRRSRAVLAQAGSIAHLGAWEVEFDAAPEGPQRLSWSDETYRIFGYAPGEVVPTNRLFMDRVHAEDRQRVVEAIVAAFTQQRHYEIEHRIVRPDGAERVVIEHADIAYDGEGRPLRMIGAVQDITERRRAELEIRRARERLDLALKGSRLALWDCDIASGRVFLSEQWSLMLGGPEAASETTIEALAALVPAEEHEAMRAALRAVVKGETADYDVEHRVRRGDGAYLWVRSRGKVTERDAEGRARRITGTNMDITERKAAEEQRRLAASVFEEAREGILITDAAGMIVEVNRAFWELTGYSKQEVLGQTPRLLKSGHHDEAFYAALWRSLIDTGHWEGELWNRRKDGELFAIHMTISAVRGDSGATSHYIALFTDVTERIREQRKIERLAYHDALTRLPNRLLLADRMNQALARAKRGGKAVAICYMDLDGFKPVNDRYGHRAGDRLLVEVARRLEAATRAQDTVSRLGGDEFVLLLTDLESFSGGDMVLTRVLQAMAKPFDVEVGAPVTVSASIGVTVYPQDGADPDTLLRHADQAMYRAKREGRNRVCLFDRACDTA